MHIGGGHGHAAPARGDNVRLHLVKRVVQIAGEIVHAQKTQRNRLKGEWASVAPPAAKWGTNSLNLFFCFGVWETCDGVGICDALFFLQQRWQW